MKKLVVLFLLMFALVAVGCQSERAGLGKVAKQFTGAHYKVELYSGGKLVRTWEFDGVLKNEENSDGYYFFYKGKLVRVSGDFVIEETVKGKE